MTKLFDVEMIIDVVDVPPLLKSAFDQAVLSGLETMFSSKKTHQIFLKKIDGPGPTAEKIANGVTALMPALWKQGDLPLQVIALATVAIARAAWEFLLVTGDRGATEEVLETSIEQSVSGVLKEFGVHHSEIEPMFAHIKAMTHPQRSYAHTLH